VVLARSGLAQAFWPSLLGHVFRLNRFLLQPVTTVPEQAQVMATEKPLLFGVSGLLLVGEKGKRGKLTRS
jgi:hypothetical protein